MDYLNPDEIDLGRERASMEHGMEIDLANAMLNVVLTQFCEGCSTEYHWMFRHLFQGQSIKCPECKKELNEDTCSTVQEALASPQSLFSFHLR